MALMGVNIDKRTLPGINAGIQSTYAHGLPTTPDAVLVRFAVALAATNSLIPFLSQIVDATGVSISNYGTGSTPNMEICAIRFHSFMW